MTDTGPPALQIPEWVPDPIADKARELHQRHRKSPIAVALIQRLVSDPRMKGVWDELRKQGRDLEKGHRMTGPRYKLAKKFEAIGVDEKAAVVGLFEQAVNVGRLTLSLPPEKAVSNYWTQQAAKLRADAERIAKHPTPDKSAAAFARRLIKAAEAYEGLRFKTHDQLPGVAGSIALYMKEVFGQPMYETTAAITGTIMEVKVTGRLVRRWETALSRAASDPAKGGKKPTS
jgi:hypothetical protein